MITEIFKDIEEFPNYQISNLGRVKALPRKVKYLHGKTGNEHFRLTKEKFLSTKNTTGHGYFYVTISINGIGKSRYIHRLVALTFIPNPDNLPQVNHIDGVKTNNNLDNLEWCTNEYNTQHAIKNGLVSTSEQRSNSCLNNSRVRIIKQLLNKGITPKFLASVYNVTPETIYNIKKEFTWKQIKV
jgi:hypothetical protein